MGLTYEDFDNETQELIIKAQQLARNMNHEKVTLVHLVLVMFRDESTREVIERSLDERGEFIQLQEKVFKYLPSKKTNADETVKQYLSDDANRALSDAKKLSKFMQSKQITEAILLSAVIAMDQNRIADIFEEADVTTVKVLTKSIEYEEGEEEE